MVVARDAKSYLMGLQEVRKTDGKYVFEEPVLKVAENDWFSGFTFPVRSDMGVPSRTRVEREADSKE
jgi:hypothetical protein